MLRASYAAAMHGSNEQGEYCRAVLQEPRYKSSTLLYFTLHHDVASMLRYFGHTV